MIEGKSYTKEELIDAIQVTKKFFQSHNKAIIEYLDYICEYTITLDPKDRRRKIYNIIKLKRPFEPYKNARTIKKEKKQSLYAEQIKKILKEDSTQTGSNIARIITKNSQDQVENGDAAETLVRYVRSELKEGYGTYFKSSSNKIKRVGYVADRCWCKLDKINNKYIRLSETELENLRELFKSVKRERMLLEFDDLGSAISEGEIGNFERQYLLSSRNAYFSAITKFKEKYHMWPVMANVYMVGKEIPQEVLDRYSEYEEKQRQLNTLDFKDAPSELLID